MRPCGVEHTLRHLRRSGLPCPSQCLVRAGANARRCFIDDERLDQRFVGGALDRPRKLGLSTGIQQVGGAGLSDGSTAGRSVGEQVALRAPNRSANSRVSGWSFTPPV